MYEKLLTAGPKYTPQMVMNGQIDVVGHQRAAIDEQLEDMSDKGLTPIRINHVPGSQFYTIALPDLNDGPYALWLAAYNFDHNITINAGANRGADMRYVNVVSALSRVEEWDGKAKMLKLSAGLRPSHKGFAILAQKPDGAIVAAGKFERGKIN